MKTAIILLWFGVGSLVVLALLNMLPNVVALPVALLLMFLGIIDGYRKLTKERG